MEIPDVYYLQNEKYIKDKAKRGIFDIVLNKCINDIHYTNKFTDKTFILFEVPNIIIGHNQYDKKSCISYLIDVFKRKNYFVDSKDGYIYIDWGNLKSKNKMNRMINSNINSQTLNLLKKKYPNASKVVFEYEN